MNRAGVDWPAAGLPQAAIEPSAAATWRAWGKGPPESRIWPVSRRLAPPLSLVCRYNLRGRGTLTRLVARVFGGKEVMLRTEWGGTFVAPPDDVYFLRGVCSEPFETAVVVRLVRSGMTVLDIGANRGWYTVLMSMLVGPSGAVHAFEPDRAAVYHLRRNVGRNPFCSNVKIHEQAVSNSSSNALFWALPDSLVSHLAEGSDRAGSGSGAVEYRIDTVRLDDFLTARSIKRLEFIKCDVEGAEVQVLEGLIPAIKRGVRPVLLIEYIEANLRKYGASLDDIPRRLNPDGRRWYRCLGLCGEHGRPEALDGPVCPGVLNLLCLPEETADRILTGLFASSG